MTEFLITIITPVFNREEIVVETIQSVLNQSCSSWEYIIIDDISTDNTWDVLQSFAKIDERIKVYKRDRKPKGAQTCRNIGIKAAKGNYLVFLDSDDLLEPFCVEQRVEFLHSKGNNDLMIFPKAKINSINNRELLINFLKYKLQIQTTDCLWSKSYLLQIGAWNEVLIRFQDIEVVIRALIKPDIKLVFSRNHKADSIFRYQESISEGANKITVYKGLISFIDEVTKLLIENGEVILISNLRLYLRSWLIHYHTIESNEMTLKLIEYFLQKKVITTRLHGVLIKSLNIFNYKLYKKIMYHFLFIIR